MTVVEDPETLGILAGAAQEFEVVRLLFLIGHPMTT
jgi:hypothetical protein